MTSNPLSAIPSIEKLLGSAALSPTLTRYGHQVVRDALREVTASIRGEVSAGTLSPSKEEAANLVAQRLNQYLVREQRPTLVRVFNLTGTVLHTNLGRSVLAPVAVTAIAQAAESAVTIEFDLVSGKRGDRDTHVESLICELTGAKAATVVNNNAAAVMICLNAIAANREVIVSRGQLVEIGGSFRIPDIMQTANAVLREVGTTNRTHLADFDKAIGPETAALMVVHPSNYQIQGFTHQPTRNELANLAHRHDLPLIDDLGSGTLIDLEQYGLGHEPTVREALAGGADLVTFSTDKLLGGPQGGIIVGRADLVARIKKSPMKRAMRCDKLTLAALEATLALYRHPERLADQLPVLARLTRNPEDIAAQATRISAVMQTELADYADCTVAACESQIGSGALPGNVLPSTAVAIRPANNSGSALEHWSRTLRELPRPVLGRVSDRKLLLDMRTMDDEPGFIAQLTMLKAALGKAN